MKHILKEKEKLLVFDCDTGETEKMTVKEFLKKYGV
jgi:restriction endonuclease